jgi:hypothetical protein
MSRSGYSDDCFNIWRRIMWRGAVGSAIRGNRGQAFLREMVSAMDALSEHKLIANKLEMNGQVCALGAVGKARGLDMSKIDYEDKDIVSAAFGIAAALAAEIAFMNDEDTYCAETPQQRFVRMRQWVVENIRC